MNRLVKKLIGCVAVLSLALVLTGCGGDGASASKKAPIDTTNVPKSVKTDPASMPKAKTD